jgi:hypothetical protein
MVGLCAFFGERGLTQDATPPAAKEQMSSGAAVLISPEDFPLGAYHLGFTTVPYLGLTGVTGALMLTEEQGKAILKIWNGGPGKYPNKGLSKEAAAERAASFPEYRAALEGILTAEQADLIRQINSWIKEFLSQGTEAEPRQNFQTQQIQSEFREFLRQHLSAEQYSNVEFFASASNRQ